MEPRRTFSVIVDGETVRDRFEPHEGPIRLNAWAGHVEIRDAVSGATMATLPMMDLADLDERPWITPVDLPSGDRMTLTVSATPCAEEDGLPEIALLVRHEAAHEAEPARDERRAFGSGGRFERWIGLSAAALLILLGFGAGFAVNELRSAGLRSRRMAQLGAPPPDVPLSVRFAAVGQRRLQLVVTGKIEGVGDVYVDWGDRTSPDPVGGTRVFQVGGRGEVRPPSVIHEYPAAVGPEGLRAVASAGVVRVGLPATRPGARLVPSQSLLVLPYGIVLDPPPPRLRIVPREADDVVPAVSEVRLKMSSITADVHLFGVDQDDRHIYHHLAALPAPRSLKDTGVQVIDTTRLGREGPFRIVAVSTNEIEAVVGAAVPWYEIPPAAPFTEIEVRHAGVIAAPTPGPSVSEVGIDTVRAKVFLPDRYAVVAVRPRREGHYWIQNDPLAASQFVEFTVQVSFGGRDHYEIWLGVTEDRHLFKAGDRLDQLVRTDPEGRLIHWVGPVELSRPRDAGKEGGR